MLRNVRQLYNKRNLLPISILKKTFLTNDYKCADAWNAQISSPILNKVNLNDFYNMLDQNYSNKGVISAVDVDIFANSLKDPTYLEELKDLLHKLRLSAETMNTLESTHHATIRNFIEYGNVEELVEMLKDPLNFGLFLDDYTANILLDKLINSQRYELAASVASVVMLQEEYTNDITCALCQYACYKYVMGYTPPEPAPPEDNKKVKIEEVKIRIKYLRNPYFDDHFDIKDTYTISGKTLNWISERVNDNVNNSLRILGLLVYKKYDKLLSFCKEVEKSKTKVYLEVLDMLKKASADEQDHKEVLEQCVSVLSNVSAAEGPLEEALKNSIENAINKSQNADISAQNKLFKSWVQIREEQLEEQSKRLDRARRIQQIQEKQTKMAEEEQKLWFFDNEDKVDLQIEEKEKLKDKTISKASTKAKTDENYIPPEILPKRR